MKTNFDFEKEKEKAINDSVYLIPSKKQE